MKNFKFKKVLFCLMAVIVCSIGVVCAAPVSPSPFLDISCPNWTDGVVMATAAVTAIPSYDLKNLACVTETVFRDLQAKYGKLYVIDIVIDTTESYQFLLRRPTRNHLEIIESYKGDVTKINDFIIKNLVVSGNETNALDDGIVFAQFNMETAKIIQQGNAFLSKA